MHNSMLTPSFIHNFAQKKKKKAENDGQKNKSIHRKITLFMSFQESKETPPQNALCAKINF